MTGGVATPELSPRPSGMGWDDPRLPFVLLPAVLVVALVAELSLRHAGVSAEGIITDAASGLAFSLAGLIAWHRRPGNRIGPIMTAIGLAWFGGDLLFAPVPLIGPLSFPAQAAARVLFAWLLLAFPSGRLESTLHRWAVGLIAAMAGTLGALQLITLNPSALCDCPDSPLAFAAGTPLADRLDGLSAAVGLGMTFILVPLVVRRVLVASAPARRALVPVLAGGAFSLLSVLPELIHQLSGRQAEPFGWLPVVWIALPLGFLWALLNQRLARAAVADLVIDLGRPPPGRAWDRPAPNAPTPLDRWPPWLSARPTPRIRIGWGLALLGLIGVALVVPSNLGALPPLTRLAAVGVGGALAASGMVAWERRPGNPIGPVLVLSGVLWMLGRLQGTAWMPLSLLANLSNSLSQALLLTVLVAFPSGRITRTAGWVLVVGGSAAIVGGNLVQVMSNPFRTTPGLEGPNPLYLPMDAGVQQALQAVTQLGVASGLLAVIGWLVVRWWRASGPARRTYLPIFMAGLATASLIFASELLLRGTDLDPAAAQVVVTIQISAFALLPVAIVVGVMRDRLARGAVADLVVELGETPAPDHLQQALSSALGDPTLEIAQWSAPDGGYVNSSGLRVDLPTHGSVRAVTLLERDGGPLAAIIHDPALLDDPGLVASVASAVRLAVENERLAEEVRLQLDEVRASRARIVEAGDAERRRLERDLHDGAQQRLVALSLALRRARSKVGDESDADLAASIDDAAALVRDALAELRELARGLHPAILSEAGLAGAVAALQKRSPIPVDVLELPEGRLPPEAEAGAYFFISEALTNVAKHAPAARATVRVNRSEGRLEIAIADDGPGGAAVLAGSGLQGLEDRMAAAGGAFELQSQPGRGTTLRAWIPLDPGQTR